MADPSSDREQQHPLYATDRQTINGLLSGEPTDLNVAELARLRIRYNGFPGARDIQSDLDRAMQRWNLTEEALFAKTRQIHQAAQVYRGRSNQREDWS